MGNHNTKSKEFALSAENAAYLELTYTKTKTNSELAIGNRDVLEVSPKKYSGASYTREEGPFKLTVTYEFQQGYPELVKLYNETFLPNHFMLLENTTKNFLQTSGSDAGRSIIVEIHHNNLNVRKEVRCSERIKLQQKAEEHFKTIEKDLLKFNDQMVAKNFIPIHLVLGQELLSQFGFSSTKQEEEATEQQMQLLYESEQQSKGKPVLIVMSSPSTNEVKQVYVPKNLKVKFSAKPWSVLEDESEGSTPSKQFKCESEQEFKDADANATFKVNVDQNSLTFARQ